MMRKFIAALMLMFLMSTTAFAVKPGEVFQATGEVYITKENSYGSNIFNKTYARQIARMDALCKLAEQVGKFYISSTDDRILDVDIIRYELNPDNKTFKLLENHARQVGAAKFTHDDDGFKCEVTMELIVPADWKE